MQANWTKVLGWPGYRGCLNVFGMALDYFILVLLLDIWPQNSYADFCFIKCGLNIVMRHGCR